MSDVVLVTGGGGFVGSAAVRHLVRRLQLGPLTVAGTHQARRVVAVVRPGGSTTRLEKLAADGSWCISEVDLRRAGRVRELFSTLRPLAVVHAALDRAVFEHDSVTFRDDLVGAPMRELVSGLARCGGRRFVHTGSAWVLPAGEDLDEATAPAPDSAYARAKNFEDELLPGIAAEAAIEWMNLRFFNLFGVYERPDRLIPYLVRRLASGEPADLSAPENVRDFTDIDLAADAYAKALQAPAAVANRLYHIGTGRGTRIAEVAALVAEVVGGAERIRYGSRPTPDLATRVQVAKIERARQDLGWATPDDLPDRVRAAARWWRERVAATPSTQPGRVVP